MHYLQRLNHILQSNYFLVILILLCVISNIIVNSNSKSIYKGNETNFKGTIKDFKIDGDKLTLTINSKESLKGTYYIKTNEEKDYLENIIGYEKEVEIIGELKTPTNNTIPNTFNYKEYLNKNNIFYIVNINSIKINKTNNIIANFKTKLYKSIKSLKNNEYTLAFILGNKELIDEEMISKNGISHLFAISGMHFSLVILALTKILRKENIKNTLIISTIILIYGYLVSFSASVIRTILTYYISKINKYLKIELKSSRLTLLIFLLLIIIKPNYIYNAGFLYTFIIVFFLELETSSNNYLSSLLKGTLIATLASIPITAIFYYKFNFLSIILNIILVPFVSFVLFPMSFIALLIPLIRDIYVLLINIFENINYAFKEIDMLTISIPKVFIGIWLVYYFFLYITITYNKRLLIVLLIILTFIIIYPKFDKNYYIYYLDVGQGDSSLIINKEKSILIDTGGKTSSNKDEWTKRKKEFHYTDNTITLLRSKGINSLSYLIITHGDFDHMGEAINLVNNFKVDKVILNCGSYNVLEKELIRVLDKKKINYYSCIKELNIDNNKLYFLQTKEYDNENDNSNVIYTELNGYKFMFMGDASITTEKEIINKYNLSDIDIFKVGHHGSRTSSSKEFIDEINPKYSVLSVGKNNRYGHPNKEVLDNLNNSKIYRTDQDGSIMFKIKNNRLKVETCSP